MSKRKTPEQFEGISAADMLESKEFLANLSEEEQEPENMRIAHQYILKLVNPVCKKHGFCNFSNGYLAAATGRTLVYMSHCITDLVRWGYLYRRLNHDNPTAPGEVTGRDLLIVPKKMRERLRDLKRSNGADELHHAELMAAWLGKYDKHAAKVRGKQATLCRLFKWAALLNVSRYLIIELINSPKYEEVTLEKIMEKLAMLQVSRTDIDNPAGWLRRAVEDDWKPNEAAKKVLLQGRMWPRLTAAELKFHHVPKLQSSQPAETIEEKCHRLGATGGGVAAVKAAEAHRRAVFEAGRIY